MLVDAHVHLYPVFDRARFVAAAIANFASAAQKLGVPPGPAGLFLTETTRDNAFEELAGGQGVPAGWELETLPTDPDALWLHGPEQAALLFVAGRQLVSAEGLEVLAVGHRDIASDGLPLVEIVEALSSAGVPAILPWAAGKWIGKRGRVLDSLLASAAKSKCLLGDNAGRPLGWRTPPPFGSGLPVLPGSDPLPLQDAATEAGSFGFVLDGDPDPVRPAEDIRQRLIQMTTQPATFGRRVGPFGFVRRQVQLRAAK